MKLQASKRAFSEARGNINAEIYRFWKARWSTFQKSFDGFREGILCAKDILGDFGCGAALAHLPALRVVGIEEVGECSSFRPAKWRNGR